MYENKLHLYNGLEGAPDLEELTSHFMGALFGFAVGSTLCYSYEFHPRADVPAIMAFRGGGPEKLKAGQMNEVTRKSLQILDKLLDNRPNFGEKAMEILTEQKGSVSDQMEKSFEWMLLYQSTNTDDVLGLVFPALIMGFPQKAMTISRLVQNHPVTDAVVWDYYTVMREALLFHRVCHSPDLYGGNPVKLMDPDGKVTTTFNNAVVYTYQGLGFDRTMALICGQGGHTTMTGAIAGSLWGAHYGVEKVPHVKELEDSEWICRLGMAALGQITAV